MIYKYLIIFTQAKRKNRPGVKKYKTIAVRNILALGSNIIFLFLYFLHYYLVIDV